MKIKILSHNDPFGTGVGIRLVWHPIMDGPLENYIKDGWTVEEKEIERGSIADKRRNEVITIKKKKE